MLHEASRLRVPVRSTIIPPGLCPEGRPETVTLALHREEPMYAYVKNVGVPALVREALAFRPGRVA